MHLCYCDYLRGENAVNRCFSQKKKKEKKEAAINTIVTAINDYIVPKRYYTAMMPNDIYSNQLIDT